MTGRGYMTNYKDMKVKTGGMLRCCIDTIINLSKKAKFCEGQIIDCKHEPEGNGAIIVKNGAFCWNEDGRKNDQK